MAMPALHPRYTVRDLQDLPADGQRYELLRGELVVSPAPSRHHQRLVQRLGFQLGRYLEPLGLVETLVFVLGDVTWGDDVLVEPDLFVHRPDQGAADWNTITHLRLAAEVLSPSSRRRDLVDKRLLYQAHGVETYWALDPEARLVEVWQPGDARPLIATEVLEWRVVPEAPTLRIELAGLFAEAPR